ncbi:tRNA pseudouridine(38-40) synthase TruA [Chitinimonas sp. BJB300]|uniref:tRNA pseudouridine(38-40) synthase TruA n=1 Tax=Chitinimonas sp. BJB300 TaxID=1559339 RepID=UPI000C0CF6FA|nr:tRNA pseudouridine(38-40) synthase TruA [Chitinimonas sp. BJB300]PHV13315.1 tRNA pseudouridine(38-40) synthase TruA [Chitinimonas sp. BJB300]TSJ85980.1 tRNA pseudouridine(38-40) synthase TruA [Chitinimonas sp. BJB300]
MRIALGLEYDGRAFCGWQSQPNGLSVQNALESAVARMAGMPVRIHAAGRTDAGVHASRQIVHFDTEVKRPITAWVRGVNSFLPAGVAVLWADVVDPQFHARFSALARHYRYLLLNHPVRPALLAGRVGWHHAPLSLASMRAAATCLIGEHDFSSFRAAECQAASPIKHLLRFEIQQQGDLFSIDVSASGFLHHMVRNLMGALVHIGKGAAEPGWMNELLVACDRTVAPPTFMPDGLYFAGVSYPPSFGIASEPSFRHYLV